MPKAKPEELRERALVLLGEGQSVRAVAATLGVSKSTIGEWKKLPPTDILDLSAMVRDGTTLATMADDDPGSLTADDSLIASGLVVKAQDTGRVLMLQRSFEDPQDPAAGTWEWISGHLKPNEDPLEAAKREWLEEIGLSLPDGEVVGSWISPNGIWRGFLYSIPEEGAVDLANRDTSGNPDGDTFEAVAWWAANDVPGMPALRPECLTSDWNLIMRASETADLLVASEYHDSRKTPAEHLHEDESGEQPAIVWDLHKTLTPSPGYPLAPPFPWVKPLFDKLAAQGVCHHLATAALYWRHPPDVLRVRRQATIAWKNNAGLPVDDNALFGKVGADLYIDDRMVDASTPDGDYIEAELYKILNQRAELVDGVWKLKEMGQVGDPIEDFPALADVPADQPRGYSTRILDVDIHRTLLEANSSKNDSQVKAGAVKVLRQAYDDNIQIHLSCAGWDPSTKDPDTSDARLAGLVRTVRREGPPYDLIVAKVHGTAFVDDKGMRFEGNWAKQAPAIFKRLASIDNENEGEITAPSAEEDTLKQLRAAEKTTRVAVDPEKTDQKQDPQHRKRTQTEDEEPRSGRTGPDRFERTGPAINEDSPSTPTEPGKLQTDSRAMVQERGSQDEKSGTGLPRGESEEMRDVSALGGLPADRPMGQTPVDLGLHDHPVLNRLYIEAMNRYANLINNGVARHHALAAVKRIDPDFYIQEAQHAWLYTQLANRAKGQKGHPPTDTDKPDPEPGFPSLVKMGEFDQEGLLLAIAAFESTGKREPELLLMGWSPPQPTPPPHVTSVYDQYEWTADDTAALQDYLAGLYREQYLETLNDHLTRSGASVVSDITDPDVLAGLDARAAEVAVGVGSTFNSELANQTYATWIDQRSELGTQSSRYTLEQEIDQWAEDRADWKADQITTSEAGWATHQAADDFIQNNPDAATTGHVEGPDPAAEPECQELLDRGTMDADELRDIDFPIHPNCEHVPVYDVDPNWAQNQDDVWAAQAPDAGDEIAAAEFSEAVSEKIKYLIGEGKDQDQAVAIALSMERRGELSGSEKCLFHEPHLCDCASFGDTPGHEFHGNQWVAGTGGAWNQDWVQGQHGGASFKTPEATVDVVNPRATVGETVFVGGSRTLVDPSAVNAKIATMPKDTKILTSPTHGASAAVRAAAIQHGLPMEVRTANFDKYPTKEKAYFARDEEMIRAADRVVQFWDSTSKGTGHEIEYAKSLGKPIDIHILPVNAGEPLKFYDDSQPRDDHGRWSSDGGSGSDTSGGEGEPRQLGWPTADLTQNDPAAALLTKQKLEADRRNQAAQDARDQLNRDFQTQGQIAEHIRVDHGLDPARQDPNLQLAHARLHSPAYDSIAPPNHDHGVKASELIAAFGDLPGHNFHGNQYTGGSGGSVADYLSRMSPEERAKNQERFAPSNLVQAKALNALLARPSAGPQVVEGEFKTDAIRPSFPTDTSKQTSLAQAISGQEGVVQDVPLDQLTATKPYLSRTAIAATIKNLDGDPAFQRAGYLPLIAKQGGKSYIVDGHHRTEGALLLGHPTVQARVFNLDTMKAAEPTWAWGDSELMLLGDLPGHDYRGNQYTGGIPGGGTASSARTSTATISPGILSDIKARAETFYAAGGSVVSFAGHTDATRNLREMANAKRDALLGSPTYNNLTFMSAALDTYKHGAQDHVIVALSPRGDPVCALSYYAAENGVNHVGYVGSSREIRGAGTAVEVELARQSPAGVFSQYTSAAKDFHAAMGRDLTPDAIASGGYSRWSAAATAQVAGLRIEGKVLNAELVFTAHDSDQWAATFAKLRADGILKFGDMPGHDFHGNQWTGGMGSGASDGPITQPLQASLNQGWLPRDQMPVVPGKLMASFAESLARQGVTSNLEQVDPRTLIPTQNQLDPAHVNEVLGRIGTAEYDRRGVALGERHIMVSKDGHILDGHHRWAANCLYAQDHPGHQIAILRMNTTINNLLAQARLFDKGAGLHPNALAAAESPDPSQPYVEIDGKWILIATDTSDGVPRRIAKPSPVAEVLKFGDRPGHDFRGNQYTGGIGGGGADQSVPPAVEAANLALTFTLAASAHEQAVTADLQSLTPTIDGAKLIGLDHRLKTADSMARKIGSDAAEKGISQARAAGEINDALRYTMTLPEANYEAGVKQAVAGLRAQGYTLTAVKNRWESGDDYQGINTKFSTRDAYTFEVQFHTPISFDTKENLNHPMFEESRTSNDPNRKAELYQRMVANADKIPVPKGASALSLGALGG